MRDWWEWDWGGGGGRPDARLAPCRAVPGAVGCTLVVRGELHASPFASLPVFSPAEARARQGTMLHLV